MAQISPRGIRKFSFISVGLAFCAAGALAIGHTQDDGPKDDKTPSHPVPKNAGIKVLYGGTQDDLAANWVQQNGKAPAWIVKDDGAMEVKPGSSDLCTKEKFKDFQLHLEFKVPYMPDGKGQGRGNSGVFLQSRYEIQLLDSYGFAKPGTGDCGAVYNKSAPLSNACKEPRQWQTYDITIRTAKADETGKVTKNAFVTVIQNGIVVQNNTEIDGVCGAAEDKLVATPGRIRLQDHGNKMQFRNVWIMPLAEEGSKDYAPH